MFFKAIRDPEKNNTNFLSHVDCKSCGSSCEKKVSADLKKERRKRFHEFASAQGSISAKVLARTMVFIHEQKGHKGPRSSVYIRL